MNIKTKITLLSLIVILVSILFYFATVTSHPQVPNQTYQSIETLEIANTPELTAKGLMYRTDLCANCGMLFVFDPPRIVHMWMKNTPTSLDMIFLNKKGVIIGIKQDTIPFQQFPTYTANKKTKYVIEMKAGFVAREELKVGMAFDIERLMSDVRT